MQRKTKSLLEELNNLSNDKNSESIFESRATHIINSAINLLSSFKESYNEELAEELEKRFLSSIKNGDPARFTRSIRRIRESKTKKLD